MVPMVVVMPMVLAVIVIMVVPMIMMAFLAMLVVVATGGGLLGLQGQEDDAHDRVGAGIEHQLEAALQK